MRAIFNGMMIKGSVYWITSVVLYSINSKEPIIANILYGSYFSVNPVQNKGRSLVMSTLSGAIFHLILLIDPECKTVIGISPLS